MAFDGRLRETHNFHVPPARHVPLPSTSGRERPNALNTDLTSSLEDPNYQAVLELPPLSYEDHSALKDNIAVNGVLVPILVDSDSPKRRIIDGVHRKRIADELGYGGPEHVCPNLDEAEMRTFGRALNLARRQLTHEQKRHLIADQLRETADRSNRWVGKQLAARVQCWPPA